MSFQPISAANGVLNRVFAVGGDYVETLARLYAGKSLIDVADGEIGVEIDPYATGNQFGIAPTKTVGSATPVSIWQSYDMLFIGAAAVVVLGALAFRK